MSDYAFAQRPNDDNNESGSDRKVSVFEVEQQQPQPQSPSSSNSILDEQNNNNINTNNGKPKRGTKIKKFGKKIGGALQKINVVKWIEDLEHDQDLADQLDRINTDTADEQERQTIRRQALEACMNAMTDHLMEFIREKPQGSYEEWICQLHPDNINGRLEGLTSTPMIDHRFYVADSDHRLLWNEHLNDTFSVDGDDGVGDNRNMTPVRHYVAARTFGNEGGVASSGTGGATGGDNSTAVEHDLFSMEPTTTTTSNHPLLLPELPLAVSNDPTTDGDITNVSADKFSGGVIDFLSM